MYRNLPGYVNCRCSPFSRLEPLSAIALFLSDFGGSDEQFVGAEFTCSSATSSTTSITSTDACAGSFDSIVGVTSVLESLSGVDCNSDSFVEMNLHSAWEIFSGSGITISALNSTIGLGSLIVPSAITLIKKGCEVRTIANKTIISNVVCHFSVRQKHVYQKPVSSILSMFHRSFSTTNRYEFVKLL